MPNEPPKPSSSDKDGKDGKATSKAEAYKSKSLGNTAQDVINQKLLAIRLRKEEELHKRRERQKVHLAGHANEPGRFDEQKSSLKVRKSEIANMISGLPRHYDPSTPPSSTVDTWQMPFQKSPAVSTVQPTKALKIIMSQSTPTSSLRGSAKSAPGDPQPQHQHQPQAHKTPPAPQAHQKRRVSVSEQAKSFFGSFKKLFSHEEGDSPAPSLLVSMASIGSSTNRPPPPKAKAQPEPPKPQFTPPPPPVPKTETGDPTKTKAERIIMAHKLDEKDIMKIISREPSKLSLHGPGPRELDFSESEINQRKKGVHIDDMFVLEDKLKAKHKVRESIFDFLKSGKDEEQHITLVPADEARKIEYEINQWHKYRKAFWCLCGASLIIGVLILTLIFYNSYTYYVVRVVKNGTLKGFSNTFTYHTDLMIFTTIILSAFGIVIFRVFPTVRYELLVRWHICIFICVMGLFIASLGVAFFYHEDITGHPKNCYSLHAMVGILVLIFMVWETGSGIYVTFKRSPQLTKFHDAMGVMTFMLCGTTCVAGYLVRALMFQAMTPRVYPASEETYTKNFLTNVAAVLILMFCCLIRYIATDFRFRRRPRPQWDCVFGRKITIEEDDNIDIEGVTLQQYVRRNLRRHFESK